MNYKIRKAVKEDEKKICDLFLEMLRTIYHTEDVSGYQDGYLDRFWTSSEDRIYVAEDGEIVAFLSVEVHHEQEDYIYLDDFSVTESYRNYGIGSKLIAAAELYAREIHFSRVYLHVEKTNSSAKSLYERLGYLVFKDEGHRYLMRKGIA